MGTIFDSESGMMWHPKVLRTRVVTCIIILFALQTIGCTTGKPAPELFSRAELTLRAAAEARADELAPMDLQRARDKFDAAKKAMAAGKYDEARRLAEVALVEAELAEAKADAEITRMAADGLRQRVDALRQDIERNATRGSSAATAKE
jgi:hypothetical protein